MARTKKKEQSLSRRIASIIAGILFICFVVLVIAVGSITSNAMQNMVESDFNNLAEGNASRIQSTLDEATLIGANIESYLVNQYERGSTMTAEEKGMGISRVTGTPINGLSVTCEDYMINESWEMTRNSENIIGVGGNFEPYAYDSTLRDYSYYINEQNAADRYVEFFAAYEEYSSQIYYQRAKETHQPYFTEPYEFDGIKRIIGSFPIIYQDQFQGCITVNIALSRFDKLIDINNEQYKTMFSTILTQDGVVVYDTEAADNIGKSISDFFAAEDVQTMKSGFTAGQAFTVDFEEGGDHYRYFCTPIDAGVDTWWSLTAIQTSDMNSAITATVVMMIILAAVILVLISGVTIMYLRKALKPIGQLVEAAHDIEHGKFAITLNMQSQDEIGKLANSFQTMGENLRMIIGDIEHILHELSRGNFRVQSTCIESYTNDYQPILLAMRNIRDNLNQTLVGINQSADQVASGSEQVASGAQALSQGATQQASAVEELAATINNISQQIQSNAENALHASHIADQTGDQIMQSNEQMQHMIDAMQDITHSSNEIGKIIKTIEDIAFQTNILALNAAVEAARAGVAGKGFAVVADEVRNLASKSADASKSTSVLIETAIASVDSGTKIANETAESLMSAVESAKTVASKIGQIAHASDAQASAITQVTQGIDQISNVVQTNSATAEQSAAASEELSGQSQTLKSLVSQFKLMQENNMLKSGQE